MDLGTREKFQTNERIVTAEEYLRRGFRRIDWVHLATEINPKHNQREQVVIKRMQALRDGGMEVHEIRNYLDDDLVGVAGQKIVVGGALGDVCCPKRANFIKEHLGCAIVDPALVTNY